MTSYRVSYLSVQVSAYRSRLVAANHKTEATSSKRESSYAVSFLPHVTISKKLSAKL